MFQVLKLRTLDREGLDASNPFEDDITFIDEEEDGSAQLKDKGGRNPFLQTGGRDSTSPFSEKVILLCYFLLKKRRAKLYECLNILLVRNF